MVRYVRDCRPVAVFAGSVDMQISAFEVFTGAWKDMPGTQNQEHLICHHEQNNNLGLPPFTVH